MPYNDIMSLPAQVQGLPEKAKSIWMSAFNQAHATGNGEETCLKIAWGAVRQFFRKNPKSGEWKEIKTKSEDPMLSKLKTLDEAVLIDYSGVGMSDRPLQAGDVIEWQLSCKDEEITDEVINSWIANFQSNARGQKIPLVVDHPFFKENTDKKARGWIADIFRRGTHEVWIRAELSKIGAEEIEAQEYLYLSPGWFPEYDHELTGEAVKDVIFEVSMTNVPAKKMLNAFSKIMCNSEDDTMEDLDKPEDPDTLDKLLEELTGISNRMDGVLKNKRGAPAIRAKLKDLAAHVMSRLQGENEKEIRAESESSETALFNLNDGADGSNITIQTKEEKSMSDKTNTTENTNVKLLSEMESRIKTLEEQTRKAVEEKAAAVKKLSEIEKARRSEQIKTMSEKWIPQAGKEEFKLKKESLPKVQEFMETLNDEQIKTFSEIIDQTPGMKVDLKVYGEDGAPGEKFPEKKMAEEEIEKQAMAKARAEKDPARQRAVYKEEVARLTAEKGGK